MNAPPTYPDGSCIGCLNNLPRCEFHEIEERAREKAARETLARVVERSRQNDLARICARHELESDEMSTRWQKAEALMARHGRYA